MTMPAVPPPAPEELSQIRRVINKIKLPLISGKASALVLFGCLAVACTLVYLVSMSLALPPWIRFELIMAAWWVVWTSALARVLYLGLPVSDDLKVPSPRSWFGSGRPAATDRGSTGRGWLGGGWDVPVVGDGEGCAWVIGIVLAIGAVILLAWVLVEIIVPVLAFLFYAMIRGMLARIVNNDHGCGGRPGRAIAWGALWATVYTAPLALLVWVIHLIVAYRAA